MPLDEELCGGYIKWRRRLARGGGAVHEDSRALAALMMTFLILGMGIRVAGAKPPIGNCPSAFDGPLTFEQIIAAYPPPPGTPDPVALLAGFDKNGDRSLFVLDVPGDAVNVIDNVARVPS